VELFQNLLPNRSQLRLKDWFFAPTEQRLTLKVISVQPEGCCSACHAATRRIHSRYQRTLKDLPCSSYAVTLVLQVRKFFCINPTCERRIFTEQLPEVTARWARRTCRLAQHLVTIGLALGGAAGARLSQRIGYSVSRNPLLELISRLPLPPIVTPKALGVDDFAFDKGRTYGTILVDLDQQRPIALLANREAETLSQWLQQHPGVEVLSRDRSTAYKQGMTQGAPDAIQVADRFHLLKNVTEVLQQALAVHGKVLKLAPVQSPSETPIRSEDFEKRLITVKPTNEAQQQFEQRRTQRQKTYQTIWQLHYEGQSTSQIAQQVAMSARTVQRYLQTSQFPERQARSDRGRSLVSPYRDYLIQQWNQGHQQMQDLFRNVQQRGYSGSYMSLTRYIQRLFPGQLQEDSVPQPASRTTSAHRQTLTPRKASYLSVQNPQARSAEDEQLLHRLLEQNPHLAPAIEFAQAFAQLVRQRQPKQLDLWLQQAQEIDIKPFERFAKSLQSDYAAVKAGVTLAISNGQVEGQVNRLKMLKRQMYGRARLGLLSRRFLLAG
jgi:transposase